MVWFTAAVCLGLVAAPLPLPSAAAPRQKSNPYFHTCRYRARYWDDCVQTVAQELRPLFADGVPELGVRPIDPLFVDSFNFSEISGKFRVHLMMHNVTMEGLSDYYVTGVRSNLQELSMEIRLRVPSLTFRANYHMDGRFLFLALSGGGTCQYNFTDVDSKIAVQGHLVRRVSDDALHFRVNTLQWTMLPSRGSSHFSVPEGDSSMYSHATSRLLNDHGEEGWRSFQSAAEQAFAEVFRERINRLMMNIPYRDLFPPGVLPLHLLELPMDDNVADEYPPLFWTRPATTTTAPTAATAANTPATSPSTTSAPTTASPSSTTTTSTPEPTPFAVDQIEDAARDMHGEAAPARDRTDAVTEAVAAGGSVDDLFITAEAVAVSLDAGTEGDAAMTDVFESTEAFTTTEESARTAADREAEQRELAHALDGVIDLRHNDSIIVVSQNADAAAVAGAAVTAGPASDRQEEGRTGDDQNQKQESAHGDAAGAVPRQDGAQDAAQGGEGVNGVVKGGASGRQDEPLGGAPPAADLDDADRRDRIASFDTAFTLDDISAPGVSPTPGALPVDVYIGESPGSQREEYSIVASDEEQPSARDHHHNESEGVELRALVVDAAATAADTITSAAERTQQVSPLTEADGVDARDRQVTTTRTDIAATSASTDPSSVEAGTEADNSIPDEDDDDMPLPRGERGAYPPATSAPDAAANGTEPAEDLSPLATLGQVVSEVAKDLIAEVTAVLIATGVSAPAGAESAEAATAGEATTNFSSRGWSDGSVTA